MQQRRNEAMKITLPVRLQAYERITLLCERVEITNALLRIRMTGMSMSDLRGALMLAISQEFDHNTSQQLYVSETLWQIISWPKMKRLPLSHGLLKDWIRKVAMRHLLAACFNCRKNKALLCFKRPW
ncbi:MAG: hypothetical protein IPL65_22000 [Lewinellaceae bacterium]|nr:hypothetical protein [Lewinellaceae bacterium]